MLLTITYTGQNTQNLGYLLYKNPARPQVFELNHGKAYVFYPEVSNERTTAALMIDIDPIDLARGKAGETGGGLFDYVNDRPYVSSSFMSTAISKVFGTAMSGRADAHQALSDSPLDLTAVITMLPCRGEQEKLRSVFEPLGYEVCYDTSISDEKFLDWGISRYVNLTLKGKVRLRDLLKHIYVLIPVFDRQKHYWVGTDEVEKLLRHGEEWLPEHPERAYITGRYLNRRKSLVNLAFERLAASNAVDDELLAEESVEKPEKKPSLNTQRLGRVVAALKAIDVKSVIDLGCGEGNLLRLLMKERQFTKIAGMDVSHIALRRASDKLKLECANEHILERIQLFQGSLTYRDARLSGYDAACVVEVIEHLDIPRLAAFERALFEFAKPPVILVTTPNKEYNVNYDFLYGEALRHGDHRFEWTRTEFRDWAVKIGSRFGYALQFSEIGEIDEKYGAPTQMGVFTACV
ncbi:MAG: 3' terminal RNA ribose 2'-O-methyltransferase Hen1 [Clostridiales bacterium]|jgi:3' terminal RNA ribose 2'-O-methyltransferase Hen1|nr:3' terminal RNA ribose 2'-O-methyltransferase Hen1 [Clostridiales bacterium]